MYAAPSTVPSVCELYEGSLFLSSFLIDLITKLETFDYICVVL